MRSLFSFLIVIGLISNHAIELSNTLPSMFGGRIKHIIAIMFENRSFDHFLGHLVTTNQKVDGCTPEMLICKNPVDPTNANSPQVPVGFDAVYVQPGDPGHNIAQTTNQLYSSKNNNIHSYPAPMNGFINDYSHHDSMKNDNGKVIMQCFNQTSLPIISTLAQQFTMFNSWFCDVPGPTEPNRLYSWMATSQGLGNDDSDRLAEGFMGPNIFEMFDTYWNYTDIPSTKKWRAYWQALPTVVFVEYTRIHPENGHFMDEFFDDLEKGDLPLYSWLDPNYSEIPGFPASDQHPDHNVLEGEKLMKKIYERLRSSPLWNDTLLLIFYDEHGGFYDHVSPYFAPNPDGINATKYGGPFDFSRIGLRVPAVLISPWLAKGYVVEQPAQNKYYNASQYTHSSLIHTLREQYTPNSPALSKRDSWSKTWQDVVMQLNEPRTDCPMTLPDVPKFDGYVPNYDEDISSFQEGVLYSAGTLCNMEKAEIDEILKRGSDVYGPILMDCVKQWQTGKVVYQRKNI